MTTFLNFGNSLSTKSITRMKSCQTKIYFYMIMLYWIQVISWSLCCPLRKRRCYQQKKLSHGQLLGWMAGPLETEANVTIWLPKNLLPGVSLQSTMDETSFSARTAANHHGRHLPFMHWSPPSSSSLTTVSSLLWYSMWTDSSHTRLTRLCYPVQL